MDDSYILRCLVDANGAVPLTSSYTPCGDTLSIYGTGRFTQGYPSIALRAGFGGVMDTATGLLCVGNGQYYDPSTGRFLTRDARPSQNNPYTPIDPTSAMLAPLALLALIFGRKKSRGKWDTLVILLVLSLSLGMELAACKVEITTTPNPENPTEPIVIVTVTNEDGETQNFQLTKTPETPTDTPTLECTDTPTPSPMPGFDLGNFLITHYNYALETDPFFIGCDNCYDANIPIWENGKIDYRTHNLAFVYGVPDTGSVSGFNWGVYQEGTGITKSGKYISIDYEHKTPDGKTVFIYQEGGRCTHLGYRAEAWKTVAASNPNLPCGSQIMIDRYPGVIFTVTDTGSEVGSTHLDVFVGSMNVADFKSQFSSSQSTYFQSKVTKVK